MSRATSPIRKRRRVSSHLELLEPRVLCALIGDIDPTASIPHDGSAVTLDGSSSAMPAAPMLTAIATDPASGTTVSGQPSTVTIVFDRPVDPSSLGWDIELYQVAADGTLTSMVDNGPAYDESLDGTGTRLTVNLNQTLPPGHYELGFTAISGLAGQDQTLLAFNPDQPLADFWVAARGMSVHDATPLGQPGPATRPTTQPGSLDLAADPSALGLYQITLDRSQPLWRVGIEVTAQREGSPLDAALALFDHDGNPIATDELGRSDAPNDPYLFAGLKPGVYYIGVSGARNLPGKPGGYNLAEGAAGSVPQNQAGGAFTLHVLADPETQPIHVQSFFLTHADPHSQAPTGLTLQFSGAIMVDPNAAGLAGSLGRAIQVVDQRGTTWPVMLSGYDEANCALTYLFANPLPPGRYTVRLPQTGGLTDLAGQSPGAAGQRPGVLAAFTVSANPPASDPHDLGALLPGAAAAGVSQFAALSPGESVTYRLVITYGGLYSFNVQHTGQPLEVTITTPNGQSRTALSSGETLTEANLTNAAPGVYLVRLRAAGSAPVLANLRVVLPAGAADSLIENGIGQGPALNLALVSPAVLTPPAPAPAPAPVPLPVPVGPVPVPPAPVTPSTGGQVTPAPQASTGPGAVELSVVVTLGNTGDFVGRPSGEGLLVTAVGPVDYALASNGPGLPPQVNWGQVAAGTLARRRRTGTAVLPGKTKPAAGERLLPPTDGAMLFDDQAVLDRDPTDTESAIDEQALGLAADIDGNAAPSLPAVDTKESGGLVRPGERLVEEPEAIEHAGLTSPLGAGVVLGILIHYRHQLRQWLFRKPSRCGSRRRGGRASSRPLTI